MSARRYHAASLVVGILPEPWVRRAGQALGWLAYSWSGRAARFADRHMRRVGGASGRQLFAHYGRYWAELLWLDRTKVDVVRRHVVAEGLEHVVAAQRAGRGMIYALPHVGNWEIAGLVAEDLGVEVVAVAEDLPDSDVTRWFVAKRQELSLEILVADGSRDLTGALRARLAAGDAVALLCDRDVTGHGVAVEFFGEETRLPSGPAFLAIRTGAPILPVAAYFRRGRGHRIVVQPPIEVVAEGSLRERMAGTTRNIARALERLIQQAPAQWHLLQPNWPSDLQ